MNGYLLSFLMELDADPKRGWPNRPIGVIFSKADQAEACFDDPEAFARQHAPGVWKQSQERFQRVAYFGTGVAGACAYRTVFPNTRLRVPLRVEPRGIIEPFEWLMAALCASKPSWRPGLTSSS